MSEYYKYICKFQTQNFVKKVIVEYIAQKPPLVDDHAFLLTGSLSNGLVRSRYKMCS